MPIFPEGARAVVADRVLAVLAREEIADRTSPHFFNAVIAKDEFFNDPNLRKSPFQGDYAARIKAMVVHDKFFGPQVLFGISYGNAPVLCATLFRIVPTNKVVQGFLGRAKQPPAPAAYSNRCRLR